MSKWDVRAANAAVRAAETAAYGATLENTYKDIKYAREKAVENLNELKDTPFKLADMIEEFNRSRIEQEHHGIPMPVIFEQNQTQNVKNGAVVKSKRMCFNLKTFTIS